MKRPLVWRLGWVAATAILIQFVAVESVLTWIAGSTAGAILVIVGAWVGD